MKKILSIIIVAFLLNSCGSTDNVEKSLADQVSGIYAVNSFTLRGQKIPLPINLGGEQLAIEMQIAKQSELLINVKLITKSTTSGNTSESTDEINNVTLSKESNGSINLTSENQRLGFYTEGLITFEIEQNGEKSSFSAAKK